MFKTKFSKINYKDYLKTEHWKRLKFIVYQNQKKELGIDYNLCELCGEKDTLEVHHMHYKRLWNVRPKHLKILCRKCHYLTHKKKIINGSLDPLKQIILN